MIVLIEYNFVKFLIFLYVFITSQINTSEIIRPRGVSISRASLYHPTTDDKFVCFDGTLTIPFIYVNDDYCDCRDGSDEPGTAACPNGVFHCTNAGHKSLNIPSSRVNDGLCDCCDGSDEYNTNKCVNTCIELGQSARLEAQKRAELYKIGNVKRLELIQRAKQIQLDKKERFDQLQKNKLEAEQIKLEKEQLKHQAEELETIVLEKYRKDEKELEENEAKIEFNRLDSNQNGIIEIEEIQTRIKFDVDRNGEVSVEEAKHVLDGNENGLEWQEFLEKSWPKIKPLAMLEEGMFKPPDEENKQQLRDDDEDEEGKEQHIHDDDVEHVEDAEDEEEEATPPPSPEEEKPTVVYDEETQNIIHKANEARDEFKNADRAVRDIEVELNEINDYLGKDFGIDNEFITLFGECYEFDDDREYIYKLCPFDKALQVSKTSGSETKLGVWSGWGESNSDNKYTEMFYNHGTSCWNGPQRTTRVYLACGVDNNVVMVTEPNRCEYEFNFETPAICLYDQQNESHADEHDEL